jgi:hypothetical protein
MNRVSTMPDAMNRVSTMPDAMNRVSTMRFFLKEKLLVLNFIGLAGKVRLAEKWAILGESWSWTSAFSDARTRFLSIGVRYSARRWNLGLGILTPFFEGTRDESIPLLTFGVAFQLL